MIAAQAFWRGQGSWAGWALRNRPDGLTELVTSSGNATIVGRLLPLATPAVDQADTGARRKKLTVRLSDAELKRVRDRASAANLTPSDYVRFVLEAQP